MDSVYAVLNTINMELLSAGIENGIAGSPRARAFLSNARQLVEALTFIDTLLDPDSSTRFTDADIASTFLRKNGRNPTWEQVNRIIDLRRVARKFS